MSKLNTANNTMSSSLEEIIKALIQNTNKQEIETIIRNLAITLLNEVKEGVRTIEETETLLFNMDILRFCEKNKVNKNIVDTIIYAMELEDIVDIVGSYKLNGAIDNCLTLLDKSRSLND